MGEYIRKTKVSIDILNKVVVLTTDIELGTTTTNISFSEVLKWANLIQKAEVNEEK